MAFECTVDRKATETALKLVRKMHYKMDMIMAFSKLAVSFILPEYVALLCMFHNHSVY